ncbi:MAG: c-type cytochrome [Campylobacterales bacterium]|nr:c-type cytochrome [Campylobacterales bacterium]
MNKTIALFLLFTTLLSAEIITPIPDVKPFDKAKVALGKKLFFDTNFSKDRTVSCASCHSDFGTDRRALSIGVENKKGIIHSSTVFNAVNNYKQFYNGRAANLNEQIDGPIHTDYEMGISDQDVENNLNTSKEYKATFKKVYNQVPSYKLFKDAIVAFEETLLTPNSRFDRFLKGEDSLTQLEKDGFNSFKEHGCAACHNGVNVGGNSMQMIGSVIEYPYIEGQQDLYALTKKEMDKNVFRVPSLRNINKTAPYFHDASASTLEEVVIKMSYYNLGTILEDKETEAIIAFLKTLDGDIPKTWSEDVK